MDSARWCRAARPIRHSRRDPCVFGAECVFRIAMQWQLDVSDMCSEGLTLPILSQLHLHDLSSAMCELRPHKPPPHRHKAARALSCAHSARRRVQRSRLVRAGAAARGRRRRGRAGPARRGGAVRRAPRAGASPTSALSCTRCASSLSVSAPGPCAHRTACSRSALARCRNFACQQVTVSAWPECQEQGEHAGVSAPLRCT